MAFRTPTWWIKIAYSKRRVKWKLKTRFNGIKLLNNCRTSVISRGSECFSIYLFVRCFPQLFHVVKPDKFWKMILSFTGGSLKRRGLRRATSSKKNNIFEWTFSHKEARIKFLLVHLKAQQTRSWITSRSVSVRDTGHGFNCRIRWHPLTLLSSFIICHPLITTAATCAWPHDCCYWCPYISCPLFQCPPSVPPSCKFIYSCCAILSNFPQFLMSFCVTLNFKISFTDIKFAVECDNSKIVF